MGEVVTKEKRTERSKMLHILSDKKRRFFHNQFIGKNRQVLFETMKNGKIQGHTDNYIQVQVDGKLELINTIHSVNLTLNHGVVVNGEISD
jgi:threonylcarbamoyladenosine tRNA methylthiotransferase MtaB